MSSARPNASARLTSASIPATTATNGKCLKFWYHMYGPHVNALNVYIKIGSHIGSAVWSRSGTKGDKWRLGYVNVRSSKFFKVRLSPYCLLVRGFFFALLGACYRLNGRLFVKVHFDLLRKAKRLRIVRFPSISLHDFVTWKVLSSKDATDRCSLRMYTNVLWFGCFKEFLVGNIAAFNDGTEFLSEASPLFKNRSISGSVYRGHRYMTSTTSCSKFALTVAASCCHQRLLALDDSTKKECAEHKRRTQWQIVCSCGVPLLRLWLE